MVLSAEAPYFAVARPGEQAVVVQNEKRIKPPGQAEAFRS